MVLRVCGTLPGMEPANLKHQLDDLRLHSQTDVHRLWELLMGPLGFAHVSLWVCLVDDRRAVVPHIIKVSDDDLHVPGDHEVAALVETLAEVMAGDPHLAGAAFLISRPGVGGITDADRVLATSLLRRCREAGIACEPVHVAHDRAIIAIAPDDLAA